MEDCLPSGVFTGPAKRDKYWARGRPPSGTNTGLADGPPSGTNTGLVDGRQAGQVLASWVAAKRDKYWARGWPPSGINTGLAEGRHAG